VVKIVDSLKAQIPGCSDHDIGVITPWREQVWRLREALRKANHFRVNVGNVEVGFRDNTIQSLLR
jgi:superfamily I DNA and/or RNA helicase